MRKRFLSLLLVLVCVLTLAAAPVAAAEPDAAQSPTPMTEPAVPSPEPTAPVEPSTEPSPEPSPEPTPTGPWYQAAMEFARAQGILFGDEHGDLLPMGNASRAQMAAMLVRVFGCTAGKDIAFFSDVNRDAWYYPELSTAVQMNILSGYGDGTIGPNRSITRQEAMSVFARAFAVSDGTAADLQAFPRSPPWPVWSGPASSTAMIPAI